MGLQTMGSLKNQWASLAQNAQRVIQLKNEIDSGVREEKDFLERYVISSLKTTALLSAISTLLPDSTWLLELKVARQPDENTFLLKGLSLPSPRTSSIQDIEKYLRDLKEEFPPETELILTTSRQIKENRELTLFTAVFKWTQNDSNSQAIL